MIACQAVSRLALLVGCAILSLPNTVQAFSDRILYCPPGSTAIVDGESSHLTEGGGRIYELADLSARGTTLTIGGVVMSNTPGSNNVLMGTDLTWSLQTTDTVYGMRGILVRVETLGVIFTLDGDAPLKIADQCSGSTTAGVSHSEPSRKTVVTGSMRFDAMGTASIDVTVVYRNFFGEGVDNASVTGHTTFQVAIVDKLAPAPVKAPTLAPLKPPTVAPKAAPVKPPVKPPVLVKVPVKSPPTMPAKAPAKAAAPVKPPLKAVPTAAKAPIKAQPKAPAMSPFKILMVNFASLPSTKAINLPAKAGAPAKAPAKVPVKTGATAPRKAPVPVSVPIKAADKAPVSSPKCQRLGGKRALAASVTVEEVDDDGAWYDASPRHDDDEEHEGEVPVVPPPPVPVAVATGAPATLAPLVPPTPVKAPVKPPVGSTCSD